MIYKANKSCGGAKTFSQVIRGSHKHSSTFCNDSLNKLINFSVNELVHMPLDHGLKTAQFRLSSLMESHRVVCQVLSNILITADRNRAKKGFFSPKKCLKKQKFHFVLVDYLILFFATTALKAKIAVTFWEKMIIKRIYDISYPKVQRSTLLWHQNCQREDLTSLIL